MRQALTGVKSELSLRFLVTSFSFIFVLMGINGLPSVAYAQTCSQIALNVSTAVKDGGFSYKISGSFGTLPDNSNYLTRSTLRLFENGVEIGPAHAPHSDIRTRGLGRYSHWSATDGSSESIRFSASNNSNPVTNGKKYSYCKSTVVSLPDVVVTSVSYVKGVFNTTVKNQGGVATPSGVVIGVAYLVDGNQKTWGSVAGPLAAGASVTIGTDGGSYVIPDGNHTIMAYVDDMNRFAESNENNNQLSNLISVSSIDSQPPTVPTSLTATAVSSSQINLSFAASTDNVGVIGYKIFRNGLQIATSISTTYSDANLAASTSYTYAVAAYDKVGNTSASSAAVTGKTLANVVDDYKIQGFAAAAGVTGGVGGQRIAVTNLNDSGAGSLRNAVQNTSGPRIVTFSPGLTGRIFLSSHVYVNYDNLTIDGTGAHITISNASINVWKGAGTAANNVIIKNLTFADTLADKNAINITHSTKNVWVDHCTFTNNSVGQTGQGIAVWNGPGEDGGLTGITLSWNKFLRPNKKSILIGSEQQIKHAAKVSLHHNFFNGPDARNPRIHGGMTVHMWNNFVSDWIEVGTAISGPSDVLLENNIFEHSGGTAVDADYGSVPANSVNSFGDLKIGSPVVETRGVFPRSMINYTPILEKADDILKQRIMNGAGAK